MPDARPLDAIICDPDAWSVRGIKPLVTAAGFEVVGEVGNAIEVIRLSELLHPALVILSLELGGISGLEAVHDLRRRAPVSSTPGDEIDPPEVIMISNDDAARAAAKEAGAFDLAVKGQAAMLERLLDEVRELIETGERRLATDRRSGDERREKQDWSKVTQERRDGTDRRGKLRREKDVTTTAAGILRQQRAPDPPG